MDEQGVTRIGYVDFGLLSKVPEQVRDGLVCAVAQMVFARNVDAVADLFGELQLLPADVLEDPLERKALINALDSTLSNVLVYENTSNMVDSSDVKSQVPTLRFDRLLDGMAQLVPRFRFKLPPYFLNNARALGTLEGMAREIEPSFNVLQVLYPYALNILLSNPKGSQVIERTLQSLIRSPVTNRISLKRAQKLLNDSAVITGLSRRKVMADVLSSGSTASLTRMIAKEQLEQTLQKRIAKYADYLRL